ncbi:MULTISPECIES: HU family DNA-binding protein [Bacillus amyloliquefaciens group]|uniref:Non-specific DNA-binding protein II (HB) (HU) n=1 Tax=Bacillus amyloliquefaciens (strain Y2) TaxID=1155777 RepID=I2C5L8_BACAY|nr:MULTISPECIES: HU family DNA-binding protein [Bacillus amyloliquefaciens group]AFJ61942.1 non-specific DNA-binding protein II (HB) (HU) [Bacillus velezensis YAU B9601-Y2]AUG35915.1 HU family DNA-binding protein [Bacillus velezensis]ERH58660.1 transcriptional regulator [Bacillus amyloliquefaciens EGD-AQ14]MCK6102303.1 HU family DNA-binding protein [Bacillus velezensis]MCK6203352.1 HU family DNA-binding protein [Bacillus velezensis]
MNKTEFIGEVAEKLGVTKKEAAPKVEAVFNVIVETLTKGESIKIPGVGTFEVRERAARKGRNPKSGEEIDIPATKAPAFKAAKSLKDAVKA